MWKYLDNFIDYLKSERRYSGHTLLSYKTDLSQFINYLENEIFENQVHPNEVDIKHVRRFIEDLFINGLNKKSISRKLSAIKSYFRYLIFVLMLVQILDTYSTLYPGSIPSLIVGEFFPGVPDNITSSIVATAGSIISIGMYFLFFNQYLVDRVGRKRMLAITILGMSIASLGMFLSVSYVMYVAFQFFLYFF